MEDFKQESLRLNEHVDEKTNENFKQIALDAQRVDRLEQQLREAIDHNAHLCGQKNSEAFQATSNNNRILSEALISF